MTLLGNADGYSPCPSLCPSPTSTTMGAEIPSEPHKLVACIVFVLIAGMSNWIALAVIHDFVGRTALPDVIFWLVPEQLWALQVGDLMVTFCAASMILIFIVHKQRVVIMRRTLFIIGVLYAFRTLSMAFTQLPSGYEDNNSQCRRQLNRSERTFPVYLMRVLEQTIHIGFQDIEDKMLCGDLLYSGHTLIMVVGSLTVRQYLPVSLQYLRYIVRFFMMLGMTCMVFSRTHYTIDVFFAYCFSVGVFTLYHAYCEIDTYRERKNSIIHRLLICRPIAWLEENVVPGRLENELSIPFVESIYQQCVNPAHKSRPADSSILTSTAKNFRQLNSQSSFISGVNVV